jgi:hypothetical protein
MSEFLWLIVGGLIVVVVFLAYNYQPTKSNRFHNVEEKAYVLGYSMPNLPKNAGMFLATMSNEEAGALHGLLKFNQQTGGRSDIASSILPRAPAALIEYINTCDQREVTLLIEYSKRI